MKKILISLSICILTQLLYSQNLIVDDNVTLKKGIYKTFEEFKNNSPSIPLEYEILSGKIVYAGFEIHNDTLYNLKVDKDKANEIGLIWGFCDGKHAYINMQPTMKRDKKTKNNIKVFKPFSQFDKIFFIGRYCYFTTGQYGGNSIYPQHWVCVLDFNTGKEIYLDNKTLKELISKDEQLLEEFKNEKLFADKDLIYYRYLSLYDQKHKDEIIR
jgi:hypothetical protein